MNPPLPNHYDPENARQLAEFAAAAYLAIGDSSVTEILDSTTDTRVSITPVGDDLVIAFRGTADLRNWLTDVDCAFHPADGCKIHAGFWRALDSVWRDVTAAIEEGRCDGKQIWLTGHSLGGALAMLYAWRLMGSRRANPVAGLYTFGQPRVGDAAFRQTWPFQAGLNACAYRVINADDIVPHVPWLLGRYRHAGHEVFYSFSPREKVAVRPDEGGSFILDRPFWQYAAGDFLTLANLYLHPQNIGKILAAHHISRYADMLSVHNLNPNLNLNLPSSQSEDVMGITIRSKIKSEAPTP